MGGVHHLVRVAVRADVITDAAWARPLGAQQGVGRPHPNVGASRQVGAAQRTASGAPLDTWRLGKSSPMPHRHDPHHLRLSPVKEAVRRNHHLAIRQVRKLRYETTRGRVPAQPSQDTLGAKPKSARGLRVVALDVRQSRQKLQTARRRESHPHFEARASSASASSRTSSRS